MIFKWILYYLFKWIKFSVKKYWKIGKKYWKSQGILSVRKSGNHDNCSFLQKFSTASIIKNLRMVLNVDYCLVLVAMGWLSNTPTGTLLRNDIALWNQHCGTLRPWKGVISFSSKLRNGSSFTAIFGNLEEGLAAYYRWVLTAWQILDPSLMSPVFFL